MLNIHTMWSCDLSPDDSDPGSSDLFLRSVNVRDLLAEVEAVKR